jgi:Fe-S-cluster containining protein
LLQLNRKQRRAQGVREKEAKEKANAKLRAMVSNIYNTYDKKRDDAEKPPLTCVKGCSACCKQVVALSLGEALYLVHKHGKLLRKKYVLLEEQCTLMEQAHIDEHGNRLDFTAGENREKICTKWWEMQQQCLFLENNLCSIYEDRPLACRNYSVISDPALCDQVDTAEVISWNPDFNVSAQFQLMYADQTTFGQVVLAPMQIILMSVLNSKYL